MLNYNQKNGVVGYMPSPLSPSEQLQQKLRDLERRREVSNIIIVKVRQLLSMKEEDGVEWCGSKADLLEMLQTAYVYGDLIHPDGSPMLMSQMVRHTFALFHLTVMKNIASHAQRALTRKGKRVLSINERIRRVLDAGGTADAVWHSLMRCPLP